MQAPHFDPVPVKKLEIEVNDVAGCFRLVSAVLSQAMIMPAQRQERIKKIDFVTSWLNQTKLIQLWSDVAEYDEDVIKKGILSKLKI